MPDRVGQQMGQYRLLKLLGRGGFAEVYLGQHVLIASRQAAIKVLHMTEVDAEAFKEAETTVQLEHPHIVRLLDFGIEQGTPFLVLDYAPGGSLRTRHPNGSIVPLASVVGYLKEIAPALQFAHDRHILHRDMKPDNMLIGRQGELLLSDFGIAVLSQTVRHSQSAPHDVGGTTYYMAPEMYRGKPEKASDQYSLGIVVYEWLAGSPPFTEGTSIQLGYQHCYEEPPPLRAKNPALSPNVEAVVMTALAKDPAKRFGSVSAFANAFEQACFPSRQTPPRVESTPRQSIPPPPPVQSTNSYISSMHSYPPQNPYTQPYTPSYANPPQVNPYPNVQQMPPFQRPYIQSPDDRAKQKRMRRNKRFLVLGGIVGGAVGGAVAVGIFSSQYPAFGGDATQRLLLGAGVGAILGVILGAILGAMSLSVIRKKVGYEALAFSGWKERGIVTLAGIVAGVAIAIVTPVTGGFALIAQIAVAVLAGIVAGNVIAGMVRKKSSLPSKSL